jgi:hypothetical protein
LASAENGVISPSDPLAFLIAFLVAALAGAVNAIAGGGTLLTFPSLLALGLESKAANATSTLGLWPGSLGGAWGYRRDIATVGKDFYLFFIPSLLGGAVGAELLLLTEEYTFDRLVPWLILGATLLFMTQGPISRWLRARQAHHVPGTPPPRRWLVVVPLQFLVAVYGGYFGAGIGILMLAALGLLGLDDIHQMNGLKTVGALCINGVAVVRFAFSGLVDWRMAGLMAAGAVAGGYLGAGLAKRIGPAKVRWVVVAVGLLSAAWTAVRPFVGG